MTAEVCWITSKLSANREALRHIGLPSSARDEWGEHPATEAKASCNPISCVRTGVRFVVGASSTHGQGLRYLGMNEITPSTAPPSTNSAGLTLYRSKISRTPTAIAAVSTPVIAPFAMVKQPASRRPIETGASPF
jgi:hypothetical protein